MSRSECPFDLQAVREQFPALGKQMPDGVPVVFFDGPAGSQVPRSVVDAVSHYMLHTNCNHGAPFQTGVESDRVLDAAQDAFADFVGAADSDCIAFGANMTTLTLSLSRALARTWRAGDEIIVSRLDHDANFTPWVLAARDAGAVVHCIDVRPDDCTLDWEQYAALLNERTRLVAVGYASNATGTINPVKKMTQAAHRVGALVYVDAVHFAPHRRIDVSELDCDFLICSAYKFFGPHVGILYGKRAHLESVTPYKLRPAPNELPGRWMTGTQNHEGIAGAMAAVNYLASLGDDTNRQTALTQAFDKIAAWETQLSDHLLSGLTARPELRVFGITDPSRFSQRVPTVSFVSSKESPREMAQRLAAVGICVWSGNHYALPFTEAMDLEPQGTLRVGLLHYNTPEEIDRFLHEL